jgi:hypothetical protein
VESAKNHLSDFPTRKRGIASVSFYRLEVTFDMNSGRKIHDDTGWWSVVELWLNQPELICDFQCSLFPRIECPFFYVLYRFVLKQFVGIGLSDKDLRDPAISTYCYLKFHIALQACYPRYFVVDGRFPMDQTNIGRGQAVK